MERNTHPKHAGTPYEVEEYRLTCSILDDGQIPEQLLYKFEFYTDGSMSVRSDGLILSAYTGTMIVTKLYEHWIINDVAMLRIGDRITGHCTNPITGTTHSYVGPSIKHISFVPCIGVDLERKYKGYPDRSLLTNPAQP